MELDGWIYARERSLCNKNLKQSNLGLWALRCPSFDLDVATLVQIYERSVHEPESHFRISVRGLHKWCGIRNYLPVCFCIHGQTFRRIEPSQCCQLSSNSHFVFRSATNSPTHMIQTPIAYARKQGIINHDLIFFLFSKRNHRSLCLRDKQMLPPYIIKLFFGAQQSM